MKNKTANYMVSKKPLNKLKTMARFFIAGHKYQILGCLCSPVSVLCVENTNSGLSKTTHKPLLEKSQT